jgi:hypothetical protein
MPAPADDQIGIFHRLQDAGVAQDVEDGVGHGLRRSRVEARIAANFVPDVDNVAQDGEKMLADTGDHFPVAKGTGRRALDVPLDAALTPQQADGETLVTFQQFLAVVEFVAAIEHCQRAIAEERVQPALTAIEQAGDFGAGEDFQRTAGGNLGINNVVGHDFYIVLHGKHSGSKSTTPTIIGFI